MSEHDTGSPMSRWEEYRDACESASTSRCRLIPGIEWSGRSNDWHFPSWGMGPAAEARPVGNILDHVVRVGGAAILAHPRRRDVWQRFEPSWTDRLSGVKICNRKSDGFATFSQAWNIYRNQYLMPVVGVDFHSAKQIWPIFMLFDLPDGENLDEKKAIAALRSRQVQPAWGKRPIVNSSGKLDLKIAKRMDRLEYLRQIGTGLRHAAKFK